MAEATKTEITIADKLDMPLDAITKLEKKKRQEERKEAQKAKRAEKSASAAGKKQDNKKTGKDNKSQKEGNGRGRDRKRTTSESERSDKKDKESDKKSDKKSEKKTDLPPITTGTPIFVSNVDPEVVPEELKEIFQKVGPVKDIEILPPKNDKPAAARVTYRLKADAEKAVEVFNNRELDGKTITVRVVRNRVVLEGRKQKEGDKKNNTRKETKDEPRSNKRQRKSSD